MGAYEKPLEKKIQRRFLPFAAIGLLALLTTALPPRPDDLGLIALAAALTIAIAAVGILTPWSRLPRWTYLLPPLAYFMVVALLRHSSEGSVSGYAPLALLPVVWVALNLGRREVSIAICSSAAVFVLPLLVGDPSTYGAGEWRRAILSSAVAAIVGFAIESLVRNKRQQAREARLQAAAIAEHEETMVTIAGVARGLTSSADARSLICQAAVDVAGANIAVIVEPDTTGDLVITGHAGAELVRSRFRHGQDPSGSAVVFAEGKRFFVEDARDHPALPQDVVEATGMISALFEPILRNGAPVGVLAVGWPHRVEDLGARATQAVVLLAAEAASAIERADLLARLRMLAETDELTGLPNRRSWDRIIRRAVADAVNGTGKLCVAIVDLDYFKEFNDRHGHQAGDRVLKAAAAAWGSALRENDTLARYGGEEFAVALPGCSPDVAERVLARLRRLTPEGMTCSVGVASWAGESATDLVARADEALYAAKRGGRDALVRAA